MRLKDKVKEINSRLILTSRGYPTVEVDFITEIGLIRSSVPSGASTGGKEAAIRLDNEKAYKGRSVYSVVAAIKLRSDEILNLDCDNIEEFDKLIMKYDNSKNKINLGANFVLPLSISFSKLLAQDCNLLLFEYLSKVYKRKPIMPIPNFNVLNGGVHSGNSLACQEIMVCFNKGSFAANLEAAAVFFEELRGLIKKKFGSIYIGVGDEGGFAPPINTIEEGIELLIETGNILNEDFKIALDCAANEFRSNGEYLLNSEKYTTLELCEYYEDLVTKYPIIYSIEDPFSEEDFDGWREIHKRLVERINIVADDLTVTNASYIEEYKGLFNTVLIKPNQVGSVSETIFAVEKAREHGCETMVSHRSAETEDTFICHLAVGIGSKYIKCGAPCRGERICKYNELLRIEEAIDKNKGKFNSN